ncbi:MAG: ATP-binding protein [Ktedonobacteraceae bacterium]
MSATQPETAHALLARHASKATPLAKRSSTSLRRLVFWQSGILALPLAILIALIIYSQFVSNPALTHFLEIFCPAVLLVLITYAILTLTENARLVHAQEQQSVKAELLHKATISLSSILEMNVLLDHIVKNSATELGFDAVALVLIEEYEHAHKTQPNLLIRATLSNAPHIAAWYISGNIFPSCTAVLGTEREVFWADELAHPLTIVQQWHTEQHVHTSLFVPLFYQHKIQGCLAFSLRAKRNVTTPERYLARAFAEEAANAIEHASLYKLASEHALFSQAISNISVRLNSAVARSMGAGSEIHQMICTEGINVLGADLAILYVHGPDGQFIAQAAVTHLPGAPTSAEEWPAIPQAVYTSLLFNARQPYLLQVEQPEYSHTTSGQRTLATVHMPVMEHTRPYLAIPHQQPTPRFQPKYHNGIRSYTRRAFTLQENLQRRHVQTAILAPLIIHQNPMGLLVLARFRQPSSSPKRAFAAQDLAHAQDFAGQAAIAFTNARLYQQLRDAHRRMQEVDQLKDQFIMTASHELRTPLTAVQGYLELLEQYQNTISPHQFQEFLQKANRGCDELVLLLNNVTDASRLEIEAGIRPAQFERIRVREVIERVIDLIGLRAAQQYRRIQVHIPSHLIVKADATHLRQVLLNLSVNALKYSPPGTPLIFSARPGVMPNSSVIISVTDRGKGIKPQDQDKLFQRFMRLESDLNSTVRGSGLGLYISRRLVEAMHGKIWIESTGTPGTGATFHIQLARA